MANVKIHVKLILQLAGMSRQAISSTRHISGNCVRG